MNITKAFEKENYAKEMLEGRFLLRHIDYYKNLEDYQRRSDNQEQIYRCIGANGREFEGESLADAFVFCAHYGKIEESHYGEYLVSVKRPKELFKRFAEKLSFLNCTSTFAKIVYSNYTDLEQEKKVIDCFGREVVWEVEKYCFYKNKIYEDDREVRMLFAYDGIRHKCDKELFIEVDPSGLGMELL